MYGKSFQRRVLKSAISLGMPVKADPKELALKYFNDVLLTLNQLTTRSTKFTPDSVQSLLVNLNADISIYNSAVAKAGLPSSAKVDAGIVRKLYALKSVYTSELAQPKYQAKLNQLATSLKKQVYAKRGLLG